MKIAYASHSVCWQGGYDGFSNVFAISEWNQTFGSTDTLTTAILTAADFMYADAVPVAWQSTDTEILRLLAQITGSSSSTSGIPSPQLD